MKLSASRESILKPLQAVIGVVERRQTMAILSHDLARLLRLLPPETCRALPDGCKVDMSVSGDRLTLKAGRSRFTLSTLPAADFPLVEEIAGEQSLEIPIADFSWLIDKTQFSMAQQDVRYYLNGLLLETEASCCGPLRPMVTGWRSRKSSCRSRRVRACRSSCLERVSSS